MKLPPATVVLAFLLGVASIAIFETVLSYQALNCSNQQQLQGANAPSDAKPVAAQKAADGGHEKKSDTVSKPFVCGVAGFPGAIRQFMNHNEGFVVGTFTLLLVFVTGWLVYVTGGLRESTEKLWLAGEQQIEVARIAANAADLSARAAVAIELPIIQIAPRGFGFGSSMSVVGGIEAPRTEWCALSDVRFSNLGRTKAFPVNIKCGWFFGDRLPDIPVYTFTKDFHLGTIFEPDPSVTPALHVNECVCENGPARFYDKVRDESVGLWFFCSLVYLDFMQGRHEAGFCWKRMETIGNGVFRADPTPAYNLKT
jgi:hypothetical protein